MVYLLLKTEKSRRVGEPRLVCLDLRYIEHHDNNKKRLNKARIKAGKQCINEKDFNLHLTNYTFFQHLNQFNVEEATIDVMISRTVLLLLKVNNINIFIGSFTVMQWQLRTGLFFV